MSSINGNNFGFKSSERKRSNNSIAKPILSLDPFSILSLIWPMDLASYASERSV